jgi:crotonobetainyl-CoA:carnitine CoA-transferase CaiB-like acyl-CoA transferase
LPSQVADVVIDGFANAALARRGFPIDEVLLRNPHLIYLDLTCFGHVGPLANGKGFQQNANFAAGVAGIEDEELLGYQLVSQVSATECH